MTQLINVVQKNHVGPGMNHMRHKYMYDLQTKKKTTVGLISSPTRNVSAAVQQPRALHDHEVLPDGIHLPSFLFCSFCGYVLVPANVHFMLTPSFVGRQGEEVARGVPSATVESNW